mgnify:CR=1 FL=1
MTTHERIDADPDFIDMKRFGYSLQALLARYPDGVPDKYIAQALSVTEEEVEMLYQQTVAKLRERMGVI